VTKTSTLTSTSTATATQSNDVIFAMLHPGFAVTTQAIAEGGDLSVTGSAALVGSYGMAALVDNANCWSSLTAKASPLPRSA
jgi:hypothetical protein